MARLQSSLAPALCAGALATVAATLAALALALGGLALAVHALFLQGLLPHSYDIDSFYAPSWEFLAHNLKAGAFPEWDPYVFGGAAFTGDPQSQVLYPPTLALFGWFSLPTATLLWFAFHYVLAGAGTYRLAHNLGLTRSACAIAAIAYAGSTYLVARAQAPTLLAGAAWMPAILAAAVGHRFREPGRRAVFLSAPLAVAFALQALSGSQQVFLLTAVACMAVALIDAQRRRVLATAASLALGVAMAAPQLIPLAVLVHNSTASSGIDHSGYGALSWGDRKLLTGAFSRTTSETAPMYLGALGAGQAFVAMVLHRSDKPARVVMTLAALSLAWSLGAAGLLVAPLFPPLATVTSHQPVRALPLAVLAFALAIGMYWNRRRSLAAATAAAGVSLATFLVAGTLGPVTASVLGGIAAATLLLMFLGTRPAWIAAIPAGFALLLAADLAVHNVNLHNTHQRPAVWQSASGFYHAPPPSARQLRREGVSIAGPRFAWLASPVVRQHQLSRVLGSVEQALLIGGGSQRYALPALSGYNPVIDRSFARAIRSSNAAGIPDRHFIYIRRPSTPLLRAYAVRYYLCTPAFCPPGMRMVWSGNGVQIREDRSALSFARIATGSGAAASVGALTATATTDEIVVRPSAHTSTAGTISVASRRDAGWHVSIDGNPAPIRSGSFGVMSVRVPAHWRSVRFSYQAPGLRIGLALAAGALLACLVGYAVSRRWPPFSRWTR